jgi:hypothetical protein
LKIRTDEHIAPAIVRAIRDMALSTGWSIDSVLESGDQGTGDVHWITKFMAEGGDAIITADTDFLKNPPQVMAVFHTGAKVIHLPHQWANAAGRLQTAHVLLWWDRIEKQLTSMKTQECYRPAWNITETGELKKIDLDFQGMAKKLKKASKKK